MTEKAIEVFVIVGRFGNFGAWHSTRDSGHAVGLECVHAFTSAEDAWRFLFGTDRTPEHERVMRHAWRVVALSATVPVEE